MSVLKEWYLSGMSSFARATRTTGFSLAVLCSLWACGSPPSVFVDAGELDAGVDPGLCPAPRTLCGDACVDLASSPNHCGVCDSPCTAADTVCADGACVPADACSDTTCGDACVDLMSSETDCGACGTTCTDEQECVRGVCECLAPLIKCDDVCVDPTRSPEHCGLCGRVCTEVLGEGATCVDGGCQLTEEVQCDDEGDDDGDDLVDCADPDCHGRTRACTCEFNGEAGVETCGVDGSWSECGPDGSEDWICAEPECTTDASCIAENGYGWECNAEGLCQLDADATFDVVLVSAIVPASRVGDDDWDEASPDPYVQLRYGSTSAAFQNSSTVRDQLSPTWGEVVLFGARAGDLRAYLEIHVYDEDSPWGDDFWCILRCGDDHIGGWSYTWSSVDRFRNGENTVFIADRLSSDPDQSGFRVVLRFVEPGSFLGGVGS